MRRRTALQWIVGLGLIGLMVAGYQTYEHYFLPAPVCDLSQTFSCVLVTESRFGEMPPGSGIATALWGLLWWIGLLGIGTATLRGISWFKDRSGFLFGYILAGVPPVIYLLIVELYILPAENGQLAICPFCTIQHLLIAIVLALGYVQLEPSPRAILTGIRQRLRK